jgi:hypothetical protein
MNNVIATRVKAPLEDWFWTHTIIGRRLKKGEKIEEEEMEYLV